MINHWTGVGRLTGSAELKYTSGGQPVAKFSICINDSYKKEGQWVERPYFFNCVVWGKYAEAMNRHLTKGRLIGVMGKLTHNPWKDGNGATHNDVSIVVSNIHLMPIPGGAKSDQPEAEPGNEAPADSEGFTDDIPF